jgi:hypothetical protein
MEEKVHHRGHRAHRESLRISGGRHMGRPSYSVFSVASVVDLFLVPLDMGWIDHFSMLA